MCVFVCVRACVRLSQMVRGTGDGMPAELASPSCALSAICSGLFWSGSVFLRRPRLKHVALFLCFSPSLSYVVDVFIY